MVGTFEFIIGVSPRCREFRHIRSHHVAILEHDYETPFYSAAKLDIELVAITLYETKHPWNEPFAKPRNIAIARIPPSSDFFRKW